MPRRPAAFAAFLGAAFLLAALLAPTSASAAERCSMKAVKGEGGQIYYVKICVETQPGDPGGPGDDGGGAPTCEIDKQGAGTPGYGPWYCVGKAVCSIAPTISPLDPPATAPPAGKEWKVQWCWPCGGCFGPPSPSFVLDGPQARPLIVQAQEAFGNLGKPEGTVSHSPTGKAVVRLQTWLWLEPGAFERMTGSSAEGLVAVAEPDTTTWDTGDGHTQGCPGGGVDIESRGSGTPCTHTYVTASPAYHGTVTRRWAVHYENGGAPVDIPGAPDELTAVTNFDLAVVETQVVTGD